ncbi:PEP-CTERM sorting domain-containing protein [Aquabacterium sp.]|uniref:PEP-CTERM sorting domain-containing protein n=1 Tax=Aquabacterium sp. TaxID=1872578 RepID=UPI001DFD7FBC|nr:PEP-CTERM sorting domain-containing protein [Aquabacterium sp.]MBT9608426.1 PEP-CTERM sorting domain-containing protein [Aquabacterium sp.]
MKFNLIAAAALMAASVSAQAAVITTSLDSIAGATVIGFESFDGFINETGTVNLGQGVSLSSDTNAELSPSERQLGTNGAWTFFLNGFAASGSNGVLDFSFDTLKSGVSAYVSHFGGESLLVEAFGLGGTLLESTTVSFAASSDGAYDEGTTIGFLRSSTDIASVRFTGVGAVVDNVAAVPEPTSLALLAVGLGVLGFAVRRRQA